MHCLQPLRTHGCVFACFFSLFLSFFSKSSLDRAGGFTLCGKYLRDNADGRESVDFNFGRSDQPEAGVEDLKDVGTFSRYSWQASQASTPVSGLAGAGWRPPTIHSLPSILLITGLSEADSRPGWGPVSARGYKQCPKPRRRVPHHKHSPRDGGRCDSLVGHQQIRRHKRT